MLKLHLAFYKTLFFINIGVSLAISIVYTAFLYTASDLDPSFPFIDVFSKATTGIFLTGGLILSIAYFEFYKKNQYSFFHNHAITRVHLFISALIINSLTGIILLILAFYA